MCADAHAFEAQIGIAGIVCDLAKLFARQTVNVCAIAIDQRADHPIRSVRVDRTEPMQARTSNQPKEHRLGLVVSRMPNGDPRGIPLGREPQERLVACFAGSSLQRRAALDRHAQRMKTHLDRRGLLRPDSIILECSSGNTGIAMSMVGAAKGYRVTILMSSGASVERRRIIRQLGAELILFESEGRYQTGIEMSRAMAAKACG